MYESSATFTIYSRKGVSIKQGNQASVSHSALKYHPDREGGDKEMFQKVREAYEKILRDDDLRKEDEVLEAMRQAYVRGNTAEVWSLWENEIMEQKMPMGHEAFSYMFGACERGSVLEELNRAKEFGVLHGKEMEEAVYNAFFNTLP